MNAVGGLHGKAARDSKAGQAKCLGEKFREPFSDEGRNTSMTDTTGNEGNGSSEGAERPRMTPRQAEAFRRAQAARWAAKPVSPAAISEELNRRLGSLKTPKQAQQQLSLLYRLGLSAKITSAMVSACTKTIDVWLKAQNLHDDRLTIAELERRIKELQAELKEANGRATR